MEAGSAPQSVDSLIERTLQLLKEKRHEEALPVIERAAAEDSTRADVIAYWGIDTKTPSPRIALLSLSAKSATKRIFG